MELPGLKLLPNTDIMSLTNTAAQNLVIFYNNSLNVINNPEEQQR